MRIKVLFLLYVFSNMLGVRMYATNLKVMTFNIRYDSGYDGRNCWDNRKNPLTEYLSKEDCDVICLQEVLHNQYIHLTQHLSQYDVVGKGRVDGKTKGEYAPIYYKKKKFDLIDSGMFCFETY